MVAGSTEDMILVLALALALALEEQCTSPNVPRSTPAKFSPEA